MPADLLTEKAVERLKTGLMLSAFLALLAGVVLVSGYAFYYDLDPENRQRVLDIVSPRAELLLGLLVLATGILGIGFLAAYQIYVNGPLRILEELRIILDANASHRIELAGPPEMKLLAAGVNELAERNETTARDLEAKVAAAKASVEEEKHRLAALMSELSQGVLVCNIDGRILLYNERARQALGTSVNPQGAVSSSLIGLGRSVFSVMDRSLLAHALESVRSRLEKNEADLNTQFVTTSRAGQLIRIQMAPVLAAGEKTARETIGGFVMTLENITRAFELDTTRDMLLQGFTEGSRASLANIRAAVETLIEYPDCNQAERDRFIQVISDEVRVLSAKLEKTTADYADSLKTRWPLEEMLGVDVIAATRRRIESRLGLSTKSESLDEALWIKADSYTLIQALTYLAARVMDSHDVREMRFGLSQQGRLAELDMIWSGPIMSQQTLYDWEMDSMRSGGEDSPLTLRDVTERHDAELIYLVEKPRQRSLLRLLLPIAKPVQQPTATRIRYDDSRPEFYDFDLFRRAAENPELDHLPLTELTYTVFDTETTGLDPAGGDEIVALGATRIVNNRLLRYETYEQLVDPKRPIAETSETIHGISYEMLRGQPAIEEILPQFHEFCDDTVLVGHNAAFDMRFLQLKEERSGVRFTQPVLDTLLLSEVLHPNQPSHALEAIAERLGVTVVARHTALGDSLVTGEVFLRMIPLLAAQGITTLREARDAAEKTLHAKVKY
jgi:DNA polymerase-3 subunit epsilon